MNITRLAIRNDRVTLVLLAVLALIGVRTYQSLPRAEDPGFTIRVALVITQWPGAAPERVEQLITDKLEKAIQEIPELDHVVSQSRNGISIVTVLVQERYKEMRPIWDTLRRKVERVEPDLPDGARKPVVDDEFSDVFGTLITLTGDGYSYAELKDIADEVRDELLLVDDVAKVEIYGAQDERVFVEYSNARLVELGLSPGQIQSFLQARNIVYSGGEIRTEDETLVLEPTGNFDSVEELARTLVPLPTGRLVRLADVADVRRGYIDPPEVLVRVGDEEGLLLAVAMREGGNIVDLGRRLEAEIERLKSEYPVGVELGFLQEQGKLVDRKVDDFVSNLLQAVTIVLVVMLISLGFRTGLVVASLIPMAILMTFIFMPMLGVGLDQLSLASLIIALGLLVDNAIVMSESIMVQIGEGKAPIEAAVGSAGELRIPLLVSSLTTAAAFLPIFLAKSAVGEYTAALFKVITTTLLCSWLLALTMIPLLCVRFLEVKPAKEEPFGGALYTSYRRVLVASLRHPILSLIVVAAAFVGAMVLFRFVPVIFFPDNDRPTVVAQFEMPTGTPMSRTLQVVAEAERFIVDEMLVSEEEAAGGKEGILEWATFLGDGGPRFFLGHDPEQASPGYALMLINTSTRAFADVAVARLKTLGTRIPGLKVKADPLATGPPAGSPVEVRLSGKDRDRVFELADKVKAKLAQMDGPVEITDDWGARAKKIIVVIDENRAQRAGVTHQDIASSLRTVFSGIQTTEYREGDKVIPVVLRSEQASAVDLERISSLNVFSQATGRSVPVAQVADIEVRWEPSKIRRRDRRRTVAVQADLEPGFTATAINGPLSEWLERESADWPVGYLWELGGEDEASNEANASIGEQLPVAGLLIILLLVGQFNSIRKPVIILVTIPLGLIGVVVGLLVLRSYFGFMTLLGVISLAGIVINNAIVLLDRIQLEMDENGLPPAQAIVEAAQRRMRPILLTTFTTLGGMIPLYLGGGPLFESMAAAIMFGLVFATLLTLGVVPILYRLLYRVSFADYRE